MTLPARPVRAKNHPLHAVSSVHELVECVIVHGRPRLAGSRFLKKLDEYLKMAEAVWFLGISQNTLRKWEDEGRMPMRVNESNRNHLFLWEDLEQRFLVKTAKQVNRKRKAKQIRGQAANPGIRR